MQLTLVQKRDVLETLRRILGEWYSVETLSRGGKNPRDSYGTPIDLERIVGVVFDEKEAVS